MANAMLGILMGMTLSLAIAIVMERVLFRGLLRVMFSAPRLVKSTVVATKPNLQSIRNAGL